MTEKWYQPDTHWQEYPAGENLPLKISSNVNLSELRATLLENGPPLPRREKKKQKNIFLYIGIEQFVTVM